jgi:hypothetical protein
MSSFQCEHCGKPILEDDDGYYTGCDHYPVAENMMRKFRKRKMGRKEPYRKPTLGDIFNGDKR